MRQKQTSTLEIGKRQIFLPWLSELGTSLLSSLHGEKSWTIARFLVTNGFDIEHPIDDLGISVLEKVLDDPEKVLGLSKVGANPNMTKDNGTCSIATLTASYAPRGVVKILVRAGTDFGRRNVFPRAALFSDTERIPVMEYLLDNCLVDIQQVENSYMKDNEILIGRGTALHMAVSVNSIKNVRFLLSKGAAEAR
ncbi:ankyrin repeat-containing protein [Fusarium heterosporum]|uniref:Ankyrin repeat-containing protein n=1 Tax=Fusarium heterosporum TaxID=42747 RepID=A0A8H5TP17_FUSHE|nr:ankyrin repeat-containing protein [Fusarium heterosporum]